MTQHTNWEDLLGELVRDICKVGHPLPKSEVRRRLMEIIQANDQQWIERIKRWLPDKDSPKLGSENQDNYIDYSNGFNSCRKKIIQAAKDDGVNLE